MRSISSSALESSVWRSPRRREKPACGAVVASSVVPVLVLAATGCAGPTLAGLAVGAWDEVGRALAAAFPVVARVSAGALASGAAAGDCAGFSPLFVAALGRRLAAGLVVAAVLDAVAGALGGTPAAPVSGPPVGVVVFSGFSLMGGFQWMPEFSSDRADKGFDRSGNAKASSRRRADPGQLAGLPRPHRLSVGEQISGGRGALPACCC